jgi:NADH-quinone oxidoreductase subunit A
VLGGTGRRSFGATLGPQVDCIIVLAAESEFLRSYLTAALMGAAGFGLVALLLGISRLIRPARDVGDKYVTYESGVNPVGWAWSQSQIRYYLFALMFVIFDVEAVFIFPWATRLEVYGVFGLIEMGVFVGVLLLGLLYAWRKGVLRWV